MSKIITEEQIENLKTLIRNRNNYFDIKEVLDNLEDSPEQSEGDAQLVEERSVVQSPSPSGDDILKDLKDLRNHHGKSSITNGDLDTIINKYGKGQLPSNKLNGL